ncbi:MAG: hypothetical protein ORN54_02595 [Cyclobacteriaceae bacterium]|nr:hypothetical protein [Cyclobacteriaceae bacterium]
MFFNSTTLILLLLVSISCQSDLYAQIDPLNFSNESVQHCLDFVYNGEFERAKTTYLALPTSQQQIKEALEIFCMRWEEVPIQFSKRKNTYLEALTKANSRPRIENPESTTHIFLSITTKLLLAEYYFGKNDRLQALWYGKKAYPLLTKFLDEQRTEPEFFFVKGLYLYYVDFYNQKGFFYRATLRLFRKGNKEQGLELLRKAAHNPSLAQTEALIYMAHITLRLENNPVGALSYSQKLLNKYPQNLKFRELYIENLFAAGKYEDGERLLREHLKVENPYYKIPALFLSGCYQLDYLKQPVRAKSTFDECLNLADGYKPLEEYRKKVELKWEAYNKPNL